MITFSLLSVFHNIKKVRFEKIKYLDCIRLYGSDKPDIRFGMELMDISEYVKGSDFKVFKSVLDNGGQVKVIKVDGYANIPRRELDGLVEYAQRYGAKGLAWIQYTETEIKSPFKKFYSEETFPNLVYFGFKGKIGFKLLLILTKVTLLFSIVKLIEPIVLSNFTIFSRLGKFLSLTVLI